MAELRLLRRSYTDAATNAAEIRALQPPRQDVRAGVAAIVEAVAAEGDAALDRYRREFETAGAEPPPVRVPADELDAALAALDTEVRGALELAARNIRAVATAACGSDTDVVLAQGQRVVSRELPVRRAAVYAPGGRAPYPSSVLMGAVTARTAGVEDVVVCAPPGPGGSAHPVILAACALAGAREVYRAGGAHIVAALAHGTASVPAVDVIVGPGGPWVQEAKRQVADRVGIDGFMGPSELVVLLEDAAAVPLVALDLLAQAEHGEDSIVVCASSDCGQLDALEAELRALAPERPTVAAAPAVLIDVPDTRAGLALSEAIAPEHLELVGAAAELLAAEVGRAGCVFVGREGATAFGDYVAGSNHVLPTGGAARFASGLSARVFRRRQSEVHIGDAGPELAAAGDAIARAEGFAVHGESMRARSVTMQDS